MYYFVDSVLNHIREGSWIGQSLRHFHGIFMLHQFHVERDLLDPLRQDVLDNWGWKPFKTNLLLRGLPHQNNSDRIECKEILKFFLLFYGAFW